MRPAGPHAPYPLKCITVSGTTPGPQPPLIKAELKAPVLFERQQDSIIDQCAHHHHYQPALGGAVIEEQPSSTANEYSLASAVLPQPFNSCCCVEQVGHLISSDWVSAAVQLNQFL